MIMVMLIWSAIVTWYMQVKEGGGLIGNAMLVACIGFIVIGLITGVLLMSLAIYVAYIDGVLLYVAVALMMTPVIALIIDTILRLR